MSLSHFWGHAPGAIRHAINVRAQYDCCYKEGEALAKREISGAVVKIRAANASPLQNAFSGRKLRSTLMQRLSPNRYSSSHVGRGHRHWTLGITQKGIGQAT